MNFPYFIAKRITFQSHRSFSRVIIRITLLAVALSLAIMIISDAIVIGFQSEIKNKVTGFASHIQVSKTRTNYAYDNEPVFYNDTFVRKVQALNDVDFIQTYATKPGIIKTEEAIEGVVLKGFSNDFNWERFNNNLYEGKPLRPGQPGADKQIVLSKMLADKLNFRVGDKVIIYFVQQPVRTRDFTVSAIYQTGVEEIDRNFVLVNIAHIQKLNGWNESMIGGYEIFLRDFSHLENADEQIRYMADISEDTQTIRDRFPQIFDWLNLLNVNVQIILILMALVASINMITALIIMILERTQMIGILKALGANFVTLSQIFVYNAMRLVGYGIILGDLLAIGLLLIQKHFHLIKLSEESYYVSSVPVYLSFWHIFFINLGAFLFCTLSLLIPSVLVSTIKPVKAIRFE